MSGAGVRHRVLFVGLVGDDGTAWDTCTMLDCFEYRGGWSIGPAWALGDISEWTEWGWEDHASGFERAYDLATLYLTGGADPGWTTDVGGLVAVWCMDEAERHARFVPAAFDTCTACGDEVPAGEGWVCGDGGFVCTACDEGAGS